MTLELNTEPGSESSADNAGADEIGGYDDNDSNLTVDFGFVPSVSLGNRVWYDLNDNGQQDSGEDGVPGVTIELYRDGETTAEASTTSDTDGYYLFDNLAPGDYVLRVVQSNFDGGAVLEDYRSSTGAEADPDSNGDLNDNGLGETSPVTSGVQSGVVELRPDDEPEDDDDLGLDGHGSVDDDNSNLTVDFGFLPTGPVSLGNLVWIDTDNDGQLNGTEIGIDDVWVRLLDNNGDPAVDINGDAIPDQQTDNGGFYRFDNLAPGEYIVEILAGNFQGTNPLAGHLSSNPTETEPDDDVDSNDNGLDDANPAANGIRSGLVLVTQDFEPSGEGDDTGGFDDNDSNLTVDFGFVPPEPVSLGNFVWIDTNNNGIYDSATESPVPDGVVLNLLNSDGTATGTTTTTTNGYYLFDNLDPGGYIVEIDSSNFAPGGPLEEHVSSTPTETSPDDDGDINDNGLNGTDPTVDGISSGVVTLTPNGEPTGEIHGGPTSPANPTPDDNNTNLTVDFGLVPRIPMSLGNRVWRDNGAGGGTADNGIMESSESGIAGVLVRLLDNNGNPAVDIDGNAVPEQTTDGSGYYLFENLAPGDYIIEIPADNFDNSGTNDVLVNHINSGPTETDPDSNGDNNDNGQDESDPAANGIRSGVVTLSVTDEPLTESSADSGSADNDGSADDNNANLTVDFGFYEPVSIGNRVWFDANDDGLLASENGIGNVLVNLLDNSGNFLQSSTTDADGYYLFDGLIPGSYIVEIDYTNFQSGGVLFGAGSSTGVEGDTDLDTTALAPAFSDNGIDDANPELNGIRSAAIELLEDDEPQQSPAGTEGDLGPDGTRQQRGRRQQQSDHRFRLRDLRSRRSAGTVAAGGGRLSDHYHQQRRASCDRRRNLSRQHGRRRRRRHSERERQRRRCERHTGR